MFSHPLVNQPANISTRHLIHPTSELTQPPTCHTAHLSVYISTTRLRYAQSAPPQCCPARPSSTQPSPGVSVSLCHSLGQRASPHPFHLLLCHLRQVQVTVVFDSSLPRVMYILDVLFVIVRHAGARPMAPRSLRCHLLSSAQCSSFVCCCLCLCVWVCVWGHVYAYIYIYVYIYIYICI